MISEHRGLYIESKFQATSDADLSLALRIDCRPRLAPAGCE